MEGIIKYKKGKKITFKFYCSNPIKSILVLTSSEKTGLPVNYSNKKNIITFDYEMRKHSQYLIVYIDNQSTITYKLQE